MGKVINYKTKGVCSTDINLEVENGKIVNVEFIRGCNGNLNGISVLVKGMDIDEAIAKLEGIKCGIKDTSCPDQLSIALKEAKAAL